MAEQNNGIINGIDTNHVREALGHVKADPEKHKVTFDVLTEWKGQTTMESRVMPLDFCGTMIERPHKLLIDEPIPLAGSDKHMNPQEALFAALNSCIMTGISLGASMNGIKLEKVELRARGTLDLSGVFGLDPAIAPGYNHIEIQVRMKGNATQEQFQAILDRAMSRSPNYYNITQPIRIDAKLLVD